MGSVLGANSGGAVAAGGLGLVAAAAAAAGGGGGGIASLVARNLITGVVVAGPVLSTNNLQVTVYKVNADGTRGGELGKSAVAANGTFSVDAGDYKGAVIAVVTEDQTRTAGNDYKDEATGADVNLGANTTLLAVAVTAGGTTMINISPVTTIAARKAGVNADGTVTATGVTEKTVSESNTQTAIAFGLSDIINANPVLAINADGTKNPNFVSITAQTSNTDANNLKYGAVLAALSGAGYNPDGG